MYRKSGDTVFIDEVNLKLIAGKGGDGCTSFLREISKRK